MTEQETSEQPVENVQATGCVETGEQKQPTAELPAEEMQQEQSTKVETQKEEETNKEPSLEQQN